MVVRGIASIVGKGQIQKDNKHGALTLTVVLMIDSPYLDNTFTTPQ